MSRCPQAADISLIKEKIEHPFWNFNVGHLASVLAPLCVFLIGWGTLHATQTDQGRRITELEAGYRSNRDKIVDNSEKIYQKLNAIEIKVERLAVAAEIKRGSSSSNEVRPMRASTVASRKGSDDNTTRLP